MDAFELRIVDISDSEFLYCLLKDRPVEVNISHKSMPSFEQHQKFVRNWPQQYEAWYIVLDWGVPIGSVYLTHKREVGLFILASHQSKGLGTKALAKLIYDHPKNSYLANISPNNSRSMAFFQRHLFVPIKNTLEFVIGDPP
jgi:RimJ/RimL family protein N-acetyltransferase